MEYHMYMIIRTLLIALCMFGGIFWSVFFPKEDNFLTIILPMLVAIIIGIIY